MQMMNCSVGDNLSFNYQSSQLTGSGSIDGMGNTQTTGFNIQTNAVNLGCWDYWQGYYYPQIIHHSYPIYIQERALDKGKQAFEIIKMLKDKGIIKLEKVADFVDAMDALIKIL